MVALGRDPAALQQHRIALRCPRGARIGRPLLTLLERITTMGWFTKHATAQIEREQQPAAPLSPAERAIQRNKLWRTWSETRDVLESRITEKHAVTEKARARATQL